MQEQILLVDLDEDAMVESSIVDGLIGAGYEVSMVNNESGLITYTHTSKAADLLLINNREQDLPTAIRSLIHSFQQSNDIKHIIPVIIIADANWVNAVVDGFEAGANDVILRPFNCAELIARIRNMLNLFHLTRERESLPVTVGDLVIVPQSHKVQRGEKDIVLSPKEFELLLYLARHADQACSREQILKDVWDYAYELGTNVVDVYIRHLRKKVDKGFALNLIHTVRGVGYVIKEG